MRFPMALLNLVALLGVFLPSSALAQWQLDGTPVAAPDFAQYGARIITDGAGGAIVAWEDWRLDAFSDIYAQRIDALGLVQWLGDGVPLSIAENSQGAPAMVSDGAGGAIVAWHDYRSDENFHIYVQRIDAAGVVQWTTDGVALCAATHDAVDPAIVSDGAGGAIVAWADFRSGTNYDIYARRITAAGAPQWTNNGVALCTAASDQAFANIVSDGAGGAIVTWTDYRSGTNTDIYARRITSAGVAQWTANGVAMCAAGADQDSPKITSDGAGGAIVTWQDYRSLTNYDIFAQRVNSTGTVQWAANGVGLCTQASDQISVAIVADEASGAIVSWSDFRNATNWVVFGQRINATGVVQWTANGAALSTGTGDQFVTGMIEDGAAGAIVVWDNVAGIRLDIYVQRVDPLGTVLWPSEGVPICGASEDQYDARLVSDGAGGAIVAWQDDRAGDTDVFASHVAADGSIPMPTAVERGTAPAFTLRDPYPNPFGASTTLEFELPGRANVAIDVYDVGGRRVASRKYGAMNQGWQSVRIEAADNTGRRLAGGVYFVAVQANGSRVTRKIVVVR